LLREHNVLSMAQNMKLRWSPSCKTTFKNNPLVLVISEEWQRLKNVCVCACTCTRMHTHTHSLGHKSTFPYSTRKVGCKKIHASYVIIILISKKLFFNQTQIYKELCCNTAYWSSASHPCSAFAPTNCSSLFHQPGTVG
jgi:hypothetical protein